MHCTQTAVITHHLIIINHICMQVEYYRVTMPSVSVPPPLDLYKIVMKLEHWSITLPNL